MRPDPRRARFVNLTNRRSPSYMDYRGVLCDEVGRIENVRVIQVSRFRMPKWRKRRKA